MAGIAGDGLILAAITVAVIAAADPEAFGKRTKK